MLFLVSCPYSSKSLSSQKTNNADFRRHVELARTTSKRASASEDRAGGSLLRKADAVDVDSKASPRNDPTARNIAEDVLVTADHKKNRQQ